MPNIQLSGLQKEILSFFGKNSFGQNFYWTGGTLLSFQYLPYRTSVDLDFFSNDLYSDDGYLTFINELKKKVNADKITLTLQQNRRLYLIKRQNEMLKIELVFFPFPPLEPKKTLPEFSVRADSLTDIMVNKTLSTYQRNEPKDVFDLYCYLINQPKYNLSQLANLVEKKFGLAIEPTILLVKINELTNQLDSISPLLLIQQKNLTKKVKDFFQQIFDSIAKKKIR